MLVFFLPVFEPGFLNVFKSRLKHEICIAKRFLKDLALTGSTFKLSFGDTDYVLLNARFRKQKNKVVGFLKVESLAFKATYFIVFAGSQSSRADTLELYFPEKR